ncbi:MAG: 3-hexulose-6-phosphate synthase [Nitrospirota bacterium]
MALLQLALDFIHIDDAIKVASITQKYIEIIEAGTPLIKSEGIRVVKILKKKFKDKQIVADLKIMDAGDLEAKMAIEAGADIISVCSQASLETIAGAIEETRRHNKKVVIDLIGSKDKILSAKQVMHLSPDLFCLHTGLDEQTKGKKPFGILKDFIKEINMPYCIAGGIMPEDIPLIMPFKPSIIIIGGYIRKAKRPEEAAKTIKNAIDNWKSV